MKTYLPLLLCALAAPGGAYAQADILIDRGRLDRAPPEPPALQPPVKPKPPQQAQSTPSAALEPVVIKTVVVNGASAVPRAKLEQRAKEKLGDTPLTLETLRGALAAINAEYDRAGLPLHNVYAPPQKVVSGVLTLNVIEGYVTEIAIAGEITQAEQNHLKRLAAPILRDRPLRQKTLDRSFALLGATSGATIKPRFEPVPGQPAAVRLVLDVKQKTYEGGASVTNEGARLLGRTQFELMAARNGLLRPGDRAEINVGFPADPSLYQLAAVSYATPVGGDGASVQGALLYLRTRPGAFYPEGDVYSTNVKANYPLVRERKRSVDLLASFDTLSADNALFGQTFSSNRLRVLRVGASLAQGDDKARTSLAATLSTGLDILGARDGNALFGDPSFAKLVVRGGHVRKLDDKLSLTFRFAGQYAAETLPSSEQFYFGGSEFGRGLDSAAAFAERGLAGSFELSRAILPALGDYAPQITGFYDAATLSPEIYRGPQYKDLSSAGVGISLPIARTRINLQLARPLSGADKKETRLLVNAQSAF